MAKKKKEKENIQGRFQGCFCLYVCVCVCAYCIPMSTFDIDRKAHQESIDAAICWRNCMVWPDPHPQLIQVLKSNYHK